MNINENNGTLTETQEVFWNGLKGGMLGGVVVTTISPLLYAKNRLMTQQKFIFKDCMKGAPLAATSVVPQAFVVLSINCLIKQMLTRRNPERELTGNEKAVAGFISGVCSGLISTPFEFGAQNLQSGWQQSMRKVFFCSIKNSGPTVIFRGSLALMCREGIYATGYTFASHRLSAELEPLIESKTVRTVVGAGIAGLFVGAVTTPFDVLRANAQYMERGWSYMRTFKQMRFGLFSGVAARMGACLFANILMSLGTKE